jgi:hypothetical protein
MSQCRYVASVSDDSDNSSPITTSHSDAATTTAVSAAVTTSHSSHREENHVDLDSNVVLLPSSSSGKIAAVMEKPDDTNDGEGAELIISSQVQEIQSHERRQEKERRDEIHVVDQIHDDTKNMQEDGGAEEGMVLDAMQHSSALRHAVVAICASDDQPHQHHAVTNGGSCGGYSEGGCNGHEITSELDRTSSISVGQHESRLSLEGQQPNRPRQFSHGEQHNDDDSHSSDCLGLPPPDVGNE